MSQVHHLEVVVIVGQYSWVLLNLTQLVDLEVLKEWIRLWHVCWVCIQNDVFELNAVLRHAVYKVEVEVTQKVWVVKSEHIEHSQSSMVEGLNNSWDRLPLDHVALKECQHLDHQLLDFESLLEEGIVIAHEIVLHV